MRKWKVVVHNSKCGKQTVIFMLCLIFAHYKLAKRLKSDNRAMIQEKKQNINRCTEKQQKTRSPLHETHAIDINKVFSRYRSLTHLFPKRNFFVGSGVHSLNPQEERQFPWLKHVTSRTQGEITPRPSLNEIQQHNKKELYRMLQCGKHKLK